MLYGRSWKCDIFTHSNYLLSFLKDTLESKSREGETHEELDNDGDDGEDNQGKGKGKGKKPEVPLLKAQARNLERDLGITREEPPTMAEPREAQAELHKITLQVECRQRPTICLKDLYKLINRTDMKKDRDTAAGKCRRIGIAFNLATSQLFSRTSSTKALTNLFR